MLKMGSININATSRIGNAEVVYFNASFSGNSDGGESFTENITNRKLYNANMTECDADFNDFKAAARAAVAQMDVNGEQ